MKKFALLIGTLGFILLAQGQSKSSPKKYPSLFWEITGKGLSKPSYLFGTMHVSSKIVFHLPDSFYLAIKNVDVIALETNPESWQEDLVKYDVDGNSYGRRPRYDWHNFRQMPDDYLNIRTLQFDRYEKQIESALYSRPSTINNLLYRNYSDYSSDFEENTYLDMYIYQVGKKMGKRVAGVEKYGESMKLMMEAYRDAARDKNKKQRSYDNDESYSADKLQEAYRTGNLDLLDSINKLNSFSTAFDEKFLYRRNFLQANSIDSILKTRSSLFVGVGAAHLPGTRGVIEILRKMGYRLRPIIMGERDSNKKDMVEKLRVPVVFSTHSSEDNFFKVDIPGKFYRFNEDGVLDQLQYADMANGSYYMVTRIKTNSLFWGHSDQVVKSKIDSLLYENIPGRILTRQDVIRNGYRGLDITNRTRRGDVQRYNVFITPFEIIVFKMSGNGDYVKTGIESKRFFGSIHLKEFKAGPSLAWQKYQPASGGFNVSLPTEPFISNSNGMPGGKPAWRYESEDRNAGVIYTILRTDIHNYEFAEEDSFDLGLLDESFSNSAFIDKRLTRKLVNFRGYPALDCKYLHKDGSIFVTRFIIQGPHYYTLVAHAKNENAVNPNFFSSFEIKPFVYRALTEKKDTSMYYSVKTTFYPEDKKIKLTIPARENNSSYDGDDDDSGDDDETDDLPGRGGFKNNVIENDTTGEKIYVSFYRSGRYYYNDDSSSINDDRLAKNSSWIVRKRKKSETGAGWRVVEMQLSDTNSSRLIWTKRYYKNGVAYLLATEGDTLTAPSTFVKSFFETFAPVDSLKGVNPFTKKANVFFDDFFSSDTLRHKQAVNSINQIRLDSTDLAPLLRAIASLNWSAKKYLDIKKAFIGRLGDIHTNSVSNYLQKLYYAAGDTLELQYVVLESLLQQKSQYAFNVFRDIVSIEPPVVESGYNPGYSNFNLNGFRFNINSSATETGDYDSGDFWDELYDSVQLTRTILPGLLPLVNLDDYKWKTMRLLERLIDSELVKPKDYETYLTKFLIEAKQELKKQVVAEKRKLIKKASDSDMTGEGNDDNNENNEGNQKLGLYAGLLIPFWDLNPNVPVLFQQLLHTNDKKMRYSTLLLMMRNDKPVPDSLLENFAAMDDYRYTLYKDLEAMGELNLFPEKYNNHIALAKSKLFDSKSYDKPDSVYYLDKLPAAYKSKQGYVYFFRYKEKKDDLVWKLATVGLISGDENQFELTDSSGASFDGDAMFGGNTYGPGSYDFTSFTDSKLISGEPLDAQLNLQLKKLLYSRRKSAKEFYSSSKNDLDELLRFRN